jgi:hypothetical protein
MAFALIANGAIVEIADAEFPVCAGLQWVDLSSLSPAPAVGWTYSGGAFAAPVAPAAAAVDPVTEARSLLAVSDITIVRCYEHAVPVPAEWQAYRTALRAIIAGTSTTLPTKPAYPAGT